MLAALLWWSFLLFKKNTAITTSQLELLQLESNVQYRTNDFNIKELDAYIEIMEKHKRQQFMIIGEAVVFAISLILGIFLINKAHEKQVENQNRQNNFLLSVTHELRSPLTSIMLILDTIKKRILPENTLKELASDAIDEGERLDKQIHNILFAAKLDKAYSINKQDIDFFEITNSLISKYQRLYPAAEINFVNNTSLRSIRADKEGFVSIMSNLIENALKYSPKNYCKVEINSFVDENFLIIQVKDLGIGIPEEFKSKVTNQFYRVGNEDTRNSKGTGLGLYIVDKLIRGHFGYLSIKDNMPRGTIFTFKLPIQ